VALDSRKARLPNGLDFPPPGRLLGRIMPGPPRRIPLGKRALRPGARGPSTRGGE
jgi:hypothetical protein